MGAVLRLLVTHSGPQREPGRSGGGNADDEKRRDAGDHDPQNVAGDCVSQRLVVCAAVDKTRPADQRRSVQDGAGRLQQEQPCKNRTEKGNGNGGYNDSLHLRDSPLDLCVRFHEHRLEPTSV